MPDRGWRSPEDGWPTAAEWERHRGLEPISDPAWRPPTYEALDVDGEVIATLRPGPGERGVSFGVDLAPQIHAVRFSNGVTTHTVPVPS